MTYATLLLRQGVNPKYVQELLGHADISLNLNVYSHVQTWETPPLERWTLRSGSLGGVRVVSKEPRYSVGAFLFSGFCRYFRSAPGRIRTSDSRFRNAPP
jgi:hypothetical protein